MYLAPFRYIQTHHSRSLIFGTIELIAFVGQLTQHGRWTEPTDILQADFDVSQLLAACCSDERERTEEEGHILRSISKENSITSRKKGGGTFPFVSTTFYSSQPFSTNRRSIRKTS